MSSGDLTESTLAPVSSEAPESAAAADGSGRLVGGVYAARRMPAFQFRPSGAAWQRILPVILPLIAVGILVLLWNSVPVWLGFQSYEFPTFSQDISFLTSNWNVIGANLEITAVDALAGFLVGNLLAVIGAILFSQSKLIEWTFFPLAILIQTIPIVIIAPLVLIVLTVLNWGPTDALPIIGMGSKPVLVVTVLITFFPTLVNMTVGLKAVDPNLFEFMKLINSSPLRDRIDRLRSEQSLSIPNRIGRFLLRAPLVLCAGASERWKLLWRLRLPSSIPYLFSSFKITSTLCFVGAVVGEWMLAANTGIGGLINLYAFAINKQGLWAATIAVSLTSMIFFGLVMLAERLIVPWRQER